VCFTENQHAVGEFAAQGVGEAFADHGLSQLRVSTGRSRQGSLGAARLTGSPAPGQCAGRFLRRFERRG
jgi:hypothetical protein